MDDRKQPPVALMLLPLLALGAMLAVQYFAPPKAQTEESAADQAAIQPPQDVEGSADDAVPAKVAPVDARSRADSQNLYQLESDRFVASFTDLNTAMVSLQVKGERYLDEEGEPFELVTTDKEQYLPLAPSFSGVKIPADARWRLVESSKEKLSFAVGGRWRVGHPHLGARRAAVSASLLDRGSQRRSPFEVRRAWGSPPLTTSAVQTKKAVSSEGRPRLSATGSANKATTRFARIAKAS